MCYEQTESTLFEEDEDDNTLFINSLDHNYDNPFFLLEDEDEYIEYLFKQETGFGSITHFLSYDDDHDDDSRKNIFWLRTARLHAIDWIFNVSFH